MALANSSVQVFQFGEPRAELIALVFMGVLFTVIAVLAFLFLTRDNSIRRELRATFGRDLSLLPVHKALLYILPVWLFSVGWFYNDTLGSKFFTLEREQQGPRVTWNLIYEYPRRVRAIPDEDVKKWTGSIDWARRSIKHALLVQMKSGFEFQSCGIPPQRFEIVAGQLKQVGIDIPLKSPNAP